MCVCVPVCAYIRTYVHAHVCTTTYISAIFLVNSDVRMYVRTNLFNYLLWLGRYTYVTSHCIELYFITPYSQIRI